VTPTGRNDPCPCGSGKKYKKCCLPAERPAADLVSFVWRRLNAIDEKLADDILRFGRKSAGKSLLALAEAEFFGGQGAVGEHELDLQTFVPWMVYCWRPPADAWPTAPPGRPTLGDAYLARHASQLDPLEGKYLEANVQEPFSYYEVLAVNPGEAVDVEDLLRGGTRHVSERSGSETLEPGLLIWGRAVSAEGMTLFSGVGVHPLTQAEKLGVIDLAAQLRKRHRRITTEVLRAEEAHLRALYVDIRERRLHPVLPELQNTDGEALSLQTLRFRVDDPHEAFEALASLDILRSPDEILADAERDAAGRLTKGTIDWAKPGNSKHRSWDNTILGHLTIDKNALVVDVSSNQRATRIRKEIEKRLGKRIRFENAVVQSPERALAERPPSSPSEKTKAERALLQHDPTVREVLRKALTQHYTDWMDDKIPALGEKTPRHAVRTADGRAKVEALLRNAEMRTPSPGEPGMRLNLDFVRNALGLRNPGPSRPQPSLFDDE
jgi:hypothetical protein